MDDNLLVVKNLKVKFDKHLILDDVSLELKRNKTLAIIGPNGAGKTVLFKAILGLIPFEGEVTWAKNTKIGYVPQKLLITKDLPLTVAEFLNFKENNKQKVSKVLSQVGFMGDLQTRMGDLSGGELQRILIAYALLGVPNVLLFDEPTAGVDVVGEVTVYGLINKLQKETDMAIIFISHELQIVYKYAQEVLCLNKERVCYGAPTEALDKVSLAKLYGEDVHLYHHHDH